LEKSVTLPLGKSITNQATNQDIKPKAKLPQNVKNEPG